MKRSILLLLWVVGSLQAAYAQGKLKLSNYTLVSAASDEFNYADAKQLFLAGKWIAKNGLFAANSATLNTAANVSCSGGILRLRVAKASAPVLVPDASPVQYRNFTGSRLWLNVAVDALAGPCDWLLKDWRRGIQFGAIEIRCKLPQTPGAYPTFWLAGPDTELDLIDSGINDGVHSASTNWSSGVLNWRLRNTNFHRGLWADDTLAIHRSVYHPRLEDWTSGGQELKDTKNGSEGLGQHFNIYTIVWTPTYVTMFLNGREQYTVPNTVIQTDFTTTESHPPAECTPDPHYQHLAHLPGGYRSTATLELSLGATGDTTTPSVLTGEDFMEVDYVRIYKPKPGADPNNYYIHPQEYRNYEVRSTSKCESVSPSPGALAVNRHNADELFFRGTDDALYRAVRFPSNAPDDQWRSAAVDDQQGANPGWLVKGDVIFNTHYGSIHYLGADGKLHQYAYAQNQTQTGAYYHSWVDANPPAGALPLGTPRSVVSADNGDLYYIGQDHQVHTYHLAAGTWVHAVLPYAYTSSTLAMGDLTVLEGQAAQYIYYKGMNQQAQLLYYQCIGVVSSSPVLVASQFSIGNPKPYATPPLYYTWAHETLDGPLASATPVAAAPGSMTVTAAANVFFIGVDGNLHRYYRSHSWVHEQLATTSAPAVTDAARPPVPAVSSWASKPHPQGTIAYDAQANQVVYIGLDGRLQSLHTNTASPDVAGAWANRWVDDYFNTARLIGVPPATPGTAYNATSPVVALTAGPNGAIYYRGLSNHIHYFAQASSRKVNSNRADFAMPVCRLAASAPAAAWLFATKAGYKKIPHNPR